MKYNWTTKRLSEIAYINPRESIRKGIVSKKVPMDKLQPFCRDIPEFVFEEYRGGTKFRNGDTIMARITPCLENGKIAKVSILDDDEIGFGSTEYIVFRAINGICDADFLYYLICSPLVRNPAIKSTLFPELEHQLFMYHTGENMEYYILKCYQEAKNECPEVEQGLDRFDPKIKKIVL